MTYLEKDDNGIKRSGSLGPNQESASFIHGPTLPNPMIALGRWLLCNTL